MRIAASSGNEAMIFLEVAAGAVLIGQEIIVMRNRLFKKAENGFAKALEDGGAGEERAERIPIGMGVGEQNDMGRPAQLHQEG